MDSLAHASGWWGEQNSCRSPEPIPAQTTKCQTGQSKRQCDTTDRRCSSIELFIVTTIESRPFESSRWPMFGISSQ